MSFICELFDTNHMMIKAKNAPTAALNSMFFWQISHGCKQIHKMFHMSSLVQVF